MPITPAPPFPKGPGDQLRSGDWNQVVNEVIRLDNAKLNLTGGTVSGPLTITGNASTGGNAVVTGSCTVNGNLSTGGALTVAGSTAMNGGAGIGNLGGARQSTLHVAGGIWDTVGTEGDFKIGTAAHRLKIGVATAGGGAGDVRISAQGGTNRIMMGGGTANVLSITPTGVGINNITPDVALNVNGDAQIGATNTSTSRLTIYGPLQSTAQDGGLIVRAGTSGTYLRMDNNEVECNNSTLFLNFYSKRQVMIGFGTVDAGGMFVYGNLSVQGNITASGSKSGFVVDHFINKSGDVLEEGDVVVLEGSDITTFYGDNDSIPVPEVGLTTKAYDRRVCGIVVEVLVEEEPSAPESAQLGPGDGEELEEVRIDVDTGRAVGTAPGTPAAREASKLVVVKESRRVLETARSENLPLPRARARRDFGDNVKRLQVFRKEELPQLNRKKVAVGQAGKMAVLGCYAYCKVDADIAPIEVGDLLTTSPTRGHAQKVGPPAGGAAPSPPTGVGVTPSGTVLTVKSRVGAAVASPTGAAVLREEPAPAATGTAAVPEVNPLGAVIGKALGRLKSGKGKIPILVMLQ